MNVFDASAILIIVQGERGADEIMRFLDGSVMSTVNLAEVLQKSQQRGVSPTMVRGLLEEAEIGVVPFDDDMAAHTAELWNQTRSRGLSLGDRACLALTAAVGGLAITTDTGWSGLELEGIDIHLVRR